MNPWRQLRADPSIEFELRPLDDDMHAFYEEGEGVRRIVMDPSIGWCERRVAVQHELIHAERGVTGCERLDERGVDDEVARRLVPFDDLQAMWAIAVLNDLPVEPWMVAEHFDVTDAIAERAMGLFLDRPGAA